MKNSQQRSIKALAQSAYLGSSQLLVGGAGFTVGMMDLRLIPHRSGSDANGESTLANCSVQVWRPVSSGEEAVAERSVSVSGLRISGDSRRILCSYQGDQIYLYDMHRSCSHPPMSSEEELEGDEGCSFRTIGGHINYATFLKTVSFFGPRDEYVVSGSDSGHLWIWRTDSGRLTNLLTADDRTCNGVIPHPVFPLLASYGIDSDVKLWCCRSPPEADDENMETEVAQHELDGQPKEPVVQGHSLAVRTLLGADSGSCRARTEDIWHLAINGQDTEEKNIKRSLSHGDDLTIEELRHLCRFGGRGDRSRYLRTAVPLLQDGQRVPLRSPPHLLDRQIAEIFEVTEQNKKSARARFTNICLSLPSRHRRSSSSSSSPFSRVFLTANFYEAIVQCRSSKRFQYCLRSTSSGKDYSLEGGVAARGDFMPADFLHCLLNGEGRHEVQKKGFHADGNLNYENDSPFSTDLIEFVADNLLSPERGHLERATLLAHVERVLKAFHGYNQARLARRLSFSAFLSEEEELSRPSSRGPLLTYLQAPLYALFQVAVNAKNAANAAFKATDLAVAHFFYMKAIRYCRFILGFKQAEWVTRLRYKAASKPSFAAGNVGMSNDRGARYSRHTAASGNGASGLYHLNDDSDLDSDICEGNDDDDEESQEEAEASPESGQNEAAALLDCDNDTNQLEGQESEEDEEEEDDEDEDDNEEEDEGGDDYDTVGPAASKCSGIGRVENRTARGNWMKMSGDADASARMNSSANTTMEVEGKENEEDETADVFTPIQSQGQGNIEGRGPGDFFVTPPPKRSSATGNISLDWR